MERYEKFVQIGKDLGLNGKELTDFANDKEEKERELEKIQRDERHKEREHEKILKEQDVLISENRAKEQTSSAGSDGNQNCLSNHRTKVKLPKLQVFSEGKDDLDAYIRRFERFAKTAEWPDVEWAVSLGALLSGKALDVYSRLPKADADDYKKVKSALLQRYDLTEDVFRNKLRNSKLEPGETFTQFGERLPGYRKRWVETAGLKENFEDLADLILRDHARYYLFVVKIVQFLFGKDKQSHLVI
ncbi:hypothetical protein HOLleu_22149 [Holothuria leucospilota]|uniref:SCAN box domain-containing protein n=1 Tax=Holothuria leucospilota TaxID=206669 RepID=A0A9Q1BYW1_HOLLE|nr:hypothetical protein HOLleu_22149 [Holothuria leucospilota]